MSDSANALDFLTNQQYASIGSGQLSLEPTITPGLVPPWVQFPEGGYAFDYQGQVAMPAVLSTDTVLSFVVGDGYDGVIKRLSIQYTGGGGGGFNNGDITYRITIDGRPVKGYSNIVSDLGSNEFPRQTDGIRIFSNQTVAITVTHNANAAIGDPVFGTLAGWFYPRGGE